MRPGKRFLVVAAVLLSAVSFSREARAERKIGILMFSEEFRYYEAMTGITDRLKEEGFSEPNTRIVVENAGANKAKAAEMVKKYSAEKMDLIITLGTSMTIPVAREIKDVPIVFGVVYNPVDAGIARDWKSSGNNTTGASTMFPMANVLDSLMEFRKVGRLAVLYSPGEKNSEAQLKDLREIQHIYGIRIVPVPLTKKEEILQILPEVVRTCDALYITGSNLVDSQLSTIVEMATKANVVTITHLDDLVTKGVLLGVCSNSYQNGRLVGEKAVRILKGAKPSSIPIESPKEQYVMINMETSRAGQFRIPEEFMKKVTRKVH
jgi:putative tryptophan/tyrosine transport system substrate-binding protein